MYKFSKLILGFKVPESLFVACQNPDSKNELEIRLLCKREQLQNYQYFCGGN
jgi:hypothetical protein